MKYPLGLIVLFSIFMGMSGDARASLVTERFEFAFSAFAYDSNFWARVYPGATQGGPAPVSLITVAFTGAYFTPVEDAVRNGQNFMTITDPQIGVVIEPVVNLSAPGVVFAPATITGVIPNRVFYVYMYEQTAPGATRGWGSLQIDIPNLFNGLPDLDGAVAKFTYTNRNNPDAFLDSPVFLAGQWTLHREILSIENVGIPVGQVPLPGGFPAVLAGLGTLVILRRRSEGRAKAVVPSHARWRLTTLAHGAPDHGACAQK